MMQLLTRVRCAPCDGKGTIPAPHQALRVPCMECDGKGFYERWIDAQKVLSDFAETLKEQIANTLSEVLAEPARKPVRRGRDNQT